MIQFHSESPHPVLFPGSASECAWRFIQLHLLSFVGSSISTLHLPPPSPIRNPRLKTIDVIAVKLLWSRFYSNCFYTKMARETESNPVTSSTPAACKELAKHLQILSKESSLQAIMLVYYSIPSVYYMNLHENKLYNIGQYWTRFDLRYWILEWNELDDRWINSLFITPPAAESTNKLSITGETCIGMNLTLEHLVISNSRSSNPYMSYNWRQNYK